ncbi:MAG: VanZ family protein [Eubacteriales bacterium]|nr:VanZ family protein [Eubacteriales bacterium]
MKKETKRIIRQGSRLLFILYVLLLVYFLFFSEAYGRGAAAMQAYRYNLVPFAEIRRFWVYREQVGVPAFLTNIFGNVIGFLPFGFILPIIADRMQSGFLITLTGFCLSLGVETIQLVSRAGCFDVDDLILNTLGAALGYLCFAVCDHVRRTYYGKKI